MGAPSTWRLYVGTRMSDWVNWWDRLREERLAQGYTRQVDFAAEVSAKFPDSHLKQGTLSNLELGKTPKPSIKVMGPIAQTLGVRVEWLMTGAEPKVGEVGASDPVVDGFTSEISGRVRRWAEAAAKRIKGDDEDRRLYLRSRWEADGGRIPDPRPAAGDRAADPPKPEPTTELDADRDDPREQAIVLLLKDYPEAKHDAIKAQLPVAALLQHKRSKESWLEEFRTILKDKQVAERGDKGGKADREAAIAEARAKAGLGKRSR